MFLLHVGKSDDIEISNFNNQETLYIRLAR